MTADIVSDGIRACLKKKASYIVILGLFILSVCVFFYIAMQQRYALIDDFTGIHQTEYIRITSIAFTCVFAITCLFEIGEMKRISLFYILTVFLLTGLVVLGKISLLDYQSDDYEIFLSNWIYEYSEMPLWRAFGTYIGSDYSPPYLYFLAFISRIKGFPWLYFIKAISVAFDALLAFGIMKLVSLKYESAFVRLGAFFVSMVLPTVVFNGAYWSQCDVIYSSICIMAIYFALKKWDIPAMLLFGVALSYKLQSVFFFPVLLPLWIRKDIRLRWLFLIPAGYMMMMIPALLAGKSMHHVLTVYLQQSSQYGFITLNGPSVYEFLNVTPENRMSLYDLFSQMAYFLSFAYVLAVCFLVSWNRKSITKDAVLLTSLLFLSGAPFFLPKMHERYTFGADVMSLAVCLYRPRRRFLLPVCFGLSSYILYTSGLPGKALLEAKWAALFSAIGIILTLIELICVFKNERACNDQFLLIKA